jgi:hypothetical protein
METIMRKKNNHPKIWPGLLLVIFGLSNFGCKKILDVPLPDNATTFQAAFKDTSSANATVRGIYVRMALNRDFEWGGITLNAGKSADELHIIAGADNFELNTLSSADQTPFDPLRNIWTEAYVTIGQINACIEGLSASTGLNADQKRRLLGECYFDRAFSYFNLVNFYGSATALVLTTDTKTNLVAASSPEADIYRQIVADLQLAQQMMTTEYPTIDRARPNSLAATALLARTYLYMKLYSEAIAQATVVLNSGSYTPLPSLATAFLKTSNEAIWSLAAVTSSSLATPDGANFVPFFAFSTPTYELTPTLINSFESGDRRLTTWVGTVNSPGGKHYAYPQKYRNNLFDRTGSENYILLRAAEQYLIRAEANCKMNNISAAVADLNVVRTRAFTDPATGSAPPNMVLPINITAQACMAAVEQERRVELFAEWGHRWFDLKRWPGSSGNKSTRADEVLTLIKPAWRPESKLYPLSDVEIQLDHNLKQNPGY